MRPVILLVLLMSSLISPGIEAQQQKGQPTVYNLTVDCTCQDRVGKAIVSELRDEIARSPRYSQVDNTKENKPHAITLAMVSVPIDDDTNGSASRGALSTTLVIGSTYMDSFVQTRSKEKGNVCAKALLRNLDSNITP
jgi:hypothetical protein